MSMIKDLKRLQKDGLVSPPHFLLDNLQYLVISGSEAYGVSTDKSDKDIMGFCIPLKHHIWPHLNGEIEGFGTPSPRFGEWQQHHVYDEDKKQKLDFKVYSIVKFFNMLLKGNPSITNILFVPRHCVLHTTKMAELIKENRHMFLSKALWPHYKGYAFSQLRLLHRDFQGKRKETKEKYGWDLKAGYHICRLLNEIKQILMTGDLDLLQNKEQLKFIRAGGWSYEKLVEYFDEQEKLLEKLYVESDLKQSVSEKEVRDLLLECLRIHYGKLPEGF